MRSALALYIHSLKGQLRLDRDVQRDVAREVSTHLEDQIQDLVAQGMSLEEATQRATEFFGDPRRFASQMYATYNQGTWFDAAAAALPHLLSALAFAQHMWLDPEALIGLFLLTISVSAIGWLLGRPVWLYPWLGYLILPLTAMAVVLVSLLGQEIFLSITYGYSNFYAWVWLPLGLYLTLAIWLLSYLLLKISRQDWVYASLMVLPLPVLVISLLLLERWSVQRFAAADDNAAFMFLFLALASAAFIRMGRRFLKIGVVLVITPVFFFLATYATNGTQQPLVFIASLLSLFLLFSPAILTIGSGRQKADDAVWMDEARDA